MRRWIILICLLAGALALASDKKSELPSFDYNSAREHEIKPHRRSIPVEGVQQGFNQFRLTLTVSPTGDVQEADAGGDPHSLGYWPQLRPEVMQWKYTPFEVNGHAVTAEVEEYIDLVPPERLPRVHAAPPEMQPKSKVAITLGRSGCFGSCASYKLQVTTEGIVFEGLGFTAVSGKHKAAVDPDQVRQLARKFVEEDFYSMDAQYVASVTDNPTYTLSVDIDGKSKQVIDYVGEWVGMPAIIGELENDVDELADSKRWIDGSDGLVDALKAEQFNFKGAEAQTILKEAANRGNAKTVEKLLAAGVPLERLAPASKPKANAENFTAEQGWLTAAGRHTSVLQVLIDAGASKNDQHDKDLALSAAASAGNLDAVRLLLGYGANPNADLRKSMVVENSGGMSVGYDGPGSLLISAAQSGNPDVVREFLHYHPKLEAKDHEGKTALFAAAESRYNDKDGARVECVRLLIQAGANVNAKDKDGNTVLHHTFLTDVEEELLKLGAKVNARNNDGETPIFANVDNDSIPLFIKYGADLSIRNNKGQTVLEAAKDRGPQRQEALLKAIQTATQK